MYSIGPSELIALLPVVSLLMFPLWTLADVLKSEFSRNNKIHWVLAIIFLPFLGSILYMAVGRGQKVIG